MAVQRMPGITAARSEPTMAPRVSAEQTWLWSWGERKGEDAGGGGAAEPPSRRLGPAARAGHAAHRRIGRAGEREIKEGEGREEEEKDEVVEEDEGSRGARLAPDVVVVAPIVASGGWRREQPAVGIGRERYRGKFVGLYFAHAVRPCSVRTNG